MNIEKIGSMIRTLRINNNMTQKQVAEKLNLSDKAVSKWERGAGLPDISVIADLAEILKTDIGTLLCSELSKNTFNGGNMKDLKFYICPICGNISLCTKDATVLCCEKKLLPLIPQKTDQTHDLSVELIEDEWFVSSSHPMEKEHYISFVCFSTGEKLEMIKQYPEWNLECRFKRRGHGKLIWYCTNHGLFYRNI